METPLRICTARIMDFLTLGKDTPDDKVTNIKPYFEGAWGPTTNVVVNAFWSRPINYTISIASSFGTDGCQGVIARNESDVSFNFVDFPVNEDYENINPVVTLTEEPFGFIQGYNRTHQKKLADIVEQSFESFSTSLWMSIVCFVLFMAIFLKIRQKVLHDPGPEQDTSYPFFESFSFFIQHNSNDFSDVTRRIITVIISVSSFVIITGYFCNLMATDMVVVDKPDVMNTYDDILDRPVVTTLFSKPLSEYERFRNADKDSKEYKLWKVMTTERATEAEILIEPKGMEGIILSFFKVLYGLSVSIGSNLYNFGARAAFCRGKQLMGNFTDLMSYAAVDPNSPRYGKGFIFRQTNIPYLKTAAKRLRRAVEAGIGIMIKKELDEAALTSSNFGDMKIDSDNLRECMSPALVMDKPGFQAAALGNYRSLAIFVVVSLSISFAILIIENIYFFWK